MDSNRHQSCSETVPNLLKKCFETVLILVGIFFFFFYFNSFKPVTQVYIEYRECRECTVLNLYF